MAERAQTGQLGNPMQLARRASLLVGSVAFATLMVFTASTDGFAADRASEDRCGSPAGVREAAIDAALNLAFDLYRTIEVYSLNSSYESDVVSEVTYPEYTREAFGTLMPEVGNSLAGSMMRMRSVVSCELQLEGGTREIAERMLGRGGWMNESVQRHQVGDNSLKLSDLLIDQGAFFALQYAQAVNAQVDIDSPDSSMFQRILNRFMDVVDYDCRAGQCTRVHDWYPLSAREVLIILGNVVDVSAAREMLVDTPSLLATGEASRATIRRLIRPAQGFAEIALTLIQTELREPVLLGETGHYLTKSASAAADLAAWVFEEWAAAARE